jgi:rsbT co-antagonist protein RsbR
MSSESTRLQALLERESAELLRAWLNEQRGALSRHRDLMNEAELSEQSNAFLRELRSALQNGDGRDIDADEWRPMRELLSDMSRSRAKQGFTPTETAGFVFSFKQPLFALLQKELARSPEDLGREIWTATLLLDKLGLYTTEIFLKAREEVISHQQAEMLELSTPVVELWEGVLALPLIGTLDSRRTQTVMEALLQRIVDTGSEIAIIDITGVPTVDTLTAQHLIKTITATRLMGADCIISGIRPQIAQTIVHLGVDLGDVLTKSSIAGALALALKRRGLTVTKVAKQARSAASD